MDFCCSPLPINHSYGTEVIPNSRDIYLTRVFAINDLCNHFSQSFPSRQGKHMIPGSGDYKRVEARDTYAAI